ncbi:unnamed protein product [Gordionus sp. m RMFG-2023]
MNNFETSAIDETDTDSETSSILHKTINKDKSTDTKKQAHTLSEQRRRDAIKKGYDELSDLLATSDIPTSPYMINQNPSDDTNKDKNLYYNKISKAALLQKMQEYVTNLQKHVKDQENEMNKLKKEVEAMNIMKTNYQSILLIKNENKIAKNQATKNNDHNRPSNLLSPQQYDAYSTNREIKSQIFHMIMDFLFLTFNTTINIKEYCKPANLKEITSRILKQINPTKKI